MSPSLSDGFTFHHLASVDSTNSEARRLIEKGEAFDGSVIVADEQTGGRGRSGKEWHSQKGNIFCSIILQPKNLNIQQAIQLVYVAALAVAEAIPCETKLKWPNDILIEGKKVSGVLSESVANASGVVEWVIVGVGINVTSHPSDVEWPATSLGHHSDISREEVLQRLLTHFQLWFERWRSGGFDLVRKAWIDQCYAPDSPIKIKLDNSILEGIFKNIDSNGCLIIVDKSGNEITIDTGEVVA